MDVRTLWHLLPQALDLAREIVFRLGRQPPDRNKALTLGDGEVVAEAVVLHLRAEQFGGLAQKGRIGPAPSGRSVMESSLTLKSSNSFAVSVTRSSTSA